MIAAVKWRSAEGGHVLARGEHVTPEFIVSQPCLVGPASQNPGPPGTFSAAQVLVRLSCVPAVALEGPGVGRPLARPADDLPWLRDVARQIGPYTFTCVDLLGTGATSRVWLMARDQQLHVVKQLRDDLAEDLKPAALEAIEGERRVLQALRSPVGEGSRGWPFTPRSLVIPTIDLPLADSMTTICVTPHCQPLQFTPVNFKQLVKDMVSALFIAGSQGIAHRDIRPDNVMMAGEHAVVIDWGFAGEAGARLPYQGTKSFASQRVLSALAQAGGDLQLQCAVLPCDDVCSLVKVLAMLTPVRRSWAAERELDFAALADVWRHRLEAHPLFVMWQPLYSLAQRCDPADRTTYERFLASVLELMESLFSPPMV